jgi:membrane associated rhomboid family serine protease
MQGIDPQILPLLERTPDALTKHQYWRLITPLFVHSDGWRQIVFNFLAIAILGFIVERRFGRKLWLLVYFVSGLVGEIAGYAWQPLGAGASVAGAGLLGAVATWLFIKNRGLPGRFGSSVILVGAIVLTGLRDIHGPPILTGALIALAALTYSSAGKNIHSPGQL